MVLVWEIFVAAADFRTCLPSPLVAYMLDLLPSNLEAISTSPHLSLHSWLTVILSFWLRSTPIILRFSFQLLGDFITIRY
jgi:hypothetical protein